jgi:hypothetical protein
VNPKAKDAVLVILGVAVGVGIACWLPETSAPAVNAGVVFATVGLVVVAAVQAVLTSRVLADSARPFLVWGPKVIDEGEMTHCWVRNAGRSVARVTETSYTAGGTVQHSRQAVDVAPGLAVPVIEIPRTVESKVVVHYSGPGGASYELGATGEQIRRNAQACQS